jgi:hypothetical protein
MLRTHIDDDVVGMQVEFQLLRCLAVVVHVFYLEQMP